MGSLKNILIITFVITIMLWACEPVSAAIFCAGNRYVAPEDQGPKGSGTQVPGFSSQSSNSGIGGSGGGGSSSGGSSRVDSNGPIQPLTLVKLDIENEDPKIPEGYVPGTTGGVPGDDDENPEISEGYVLATTGGIFPEDYDPTDPDNTWDEESSVDPVLADAANNPEPASMILMASGLFGLGLRRFRKQ